MQASRFRSSLAGLFGFVNPVLQVSQRGRFALLAR